jgi:hypothetical protein
VDFKGLASADSAELTYVTVDVTGDRLPDLVVTKDKCDTTVGQTHWNVYEGGATGFAATPASYVVPPPTCQVDFDDLASSYGAALTFATLDVTGDGLLDLVVTKDKCDTTVGQTHWNVYEGGASGFAATAASYAVPPPTCQVDFDALASADGAALTYTVLDVNGDKIPDLVVTKDTCDTTVGQTHWNVYTGSTTGFAATPASYAVPPSTCQVQFDGVASAYGAALTYSTFDLTGDGIPDLVVTKSTCDTTVGQTHWDVYLGSASGFAATPTSYAVPPPTCQVDFDGVASAYGAALSFVMTDLTGDGNPDLVVTKSACDTTVGQTHWDAYVGSASGFAATPTSFAIPPPTCKVDFDATSASSDGPLGFAFTSLGGSCAPSLVVYSSQCDSSVGQAHWDVYAQP